MKIEWEKYLWLTREKNRNWVPKMFDDRKGNHCVGGKSSWLIGGEKNSDRVVKKLAIVYKKVGDWVGKKVGSCAGRKWLNQLWKQIGDCVETKLVHM